ncbi:NAD(P)H-dependent oxidoreductase [Microlunatus soli]|uniref:Predicted homoserine dehydrogenase, contains C-terminal SAF domain n=1 Tax=Microlunatus soli TaxID=630515 RepID=A0A1H1WDU0_9ACTN|nr:Gfo/Idh/MocA family oxidoreductase [Microlunatus soli]SDS94831.1 Predicted homoserine dehydrogenase, contains C-terminal SAF domain [Microlunatus soli]
MIIVDTALRRRAEEGRPIRVAVIGAGFMARGLVNQITNSTPGMTVSAIVNRTVGKAETAYREAGITQFRPVSTPAETERAIGADVPVLTDDFRAVIGAEQIEAVVDATGAVEYGCQLAVAAIEHGKHLILMNAEVDGTVGPLLSRRAGAAGIVLTGCDGDQPGVQLNLVRFVRGIGLRPLVCGNIKGLQDPYRTPTTQQAFAERWGQDPRMVTSFADGTKISFEQALVANATGMTVARRGMLGRDHRGHIDELTTMYDVAELERLGGVVDYTVGSRPGPGVFVLATQDDPRQRHYLDLYKLGPGPLYSFYTPYHLCHFEVPQTVARAVLFGDAAIAPLGAPTVEVVATAKRELAAGDVLDGLGGYDSYGVAERADLTATDGLLPIGVAEGCTVRHAIAKDTVLRYADVELPGGRLVDRLRTEQAAELPVGQPAAQLAEV